tara:strand:+ start:28720 stop:29019 length:300 start_codon:yes stop_codon:yes gene_type:complete
MIKLRLDKTQYIKNCSTDKSYAVRFSNYDNEMTFISVKHSTLTEITNFRAGEYWNTEWGLEFPLWLYDKFTDEQQASVQMIISENQEEDKKRWEDIPYE